MNRKMHLNLFILACGHHQAAWRHPDSKIEEMGSLDYYVSLAQMAEAAKFDAVFFADGQYNFDLANSPRWFIEPLSTLAALAAHTERIGFITTVSSTFYTPFLAARMLASIDHLSKGRVGCNIVTSMYDVEARNYNYTKMPEHAVRYARANEFIQVINRLWDSWADNALVADREGLYADLEKIQALNHAGEHFLVDGPLTVPRGPQGRPVLIQAGSSEPGRELAARFAEAIYAVAYDLPSAQAYYQDINARTQKHRPGFKPVILPGLVTYVASTEAEARAKQRELDEYLPTESALQQLSTYIGQDCSDWSLDEPLPQLPSVEEFTGPKGRYMTIMRIIETEQPTLRELLGRLAAGGGHCTMIGTPDKIADQMELWFKNGGADGFNLMPPSLPHSLQDFIEQVIPELRKRDLFRTEYAGTTLRDHFGLTRPDLYR